MTELATEFLSHVLARAEALCSEMEGGVIANDGERVTISTPTQVAHVNFYELDPGMPEIVELNSAPVDDPDNPTFFLHFEMDDLAHAKELLEELLNTLGQGMKGEATKILLSCTSASPRASLPRSLPRWRPRSRLTTSSRRCPSSRRSRLLVATRLSCWPRRCT